MDFHVTYFILLTINCFCFPSIMKKLTSTAHPLYIPPATFFSTWIPNELSPFPVQIIHTFKLSNVSLLLSCTELHIAMHWHVHDPDFSVQQHQFFLSKRCLGLQFHFWPLSFSFNQNLFFVFFRHQNSQTLTLLNYNVLPDPSPLYSNSFSFSCPTSCSIQSYSLWIQTICHQQRLQPYPPCPPLKEF